MHIDQLPLCEISNKKQSYFIRTFSDISTMVFLSGNEPIGDYYAATTALQLLDEKDFIFHSAYIIDYPDFEERSYSFSSWKNEEQLISDISNIESSFVLSSGNWPRNSIRRSTLW